jgi:predicted short-subunit dehydrogenase-like oxidoreductase (DUF2520 family)
MKDKFGVAITDNPQEIDNNGDIYILAVNDDSIANVASLVNKTEALLVHTSGTATLDLLSPYSDHTGVIWPIQTLNSEKEVDFSKLPLCIEGNNPENFEMIRELSLRISKNVIPMDTSRRQLTHLAAVFASNFSNHMYTIAASILKQNGIPFELLQPLIIETAEKAAKGDPQQGQTGPAIRNDIKVLQKHAEILKNTPELQELYNLISKSIRKNKASKK